MKEWRSLIAEDIGDGIVNGVAVLAGTPEKELTAEGFGFADPSGRFPMNCDTVVDIASVTKAAATVTALLICHARGLIDFDAPFTEYLPAFRAPLSRPVTVRHLANHTSGFGEVPGRPGRLYFDESGERMLANVLQIPPPFPPDGAPRYACWNYLLLSLILEKVTGKAFPEFCMTEIFNPLGMNSSSWGAPRPEIPERALAWSIGTEKPGTISDFVAQRIQKAGLAAGNAGMFSTACDLGKLLKCYLRHGAPLFGENEFAKIAPDRASAVDGYRRFGWVVADSHMEESHRGSALLHSGWSGQTVFFHLKKNIYIVVLTTRQGDYERAKRSRFEIIRQLCDAYQGSFYEKV